MILQMIWPFYFQDSETEADDRLKPGSSNGTDDAQQDPKINILSRQEVSNR